MTFVARAQALSPAAAAEQFFAAVGGGEEVECFGDLALVERAVLVAVGEAEEAVGGVGEGGDGKFGVVAEASGAEEGAGPEDAGLGAHAEREDAAAGAGGVVGAD